jgi:site-specific DNA-methyltransferase (adenine-specific)
MIETNYNPDVLTCLANLSNDEVFTPPNLANQMLDILPQELFSNSKTTFLDPVCKTGVFLREIAKRLMKGLEKEFPDQQKRLNHIFSKQLFGISTSELTSLLSRRSVYCSKIANSKYSICEKFTNETGNILFDKTEHEWKNGKCVFCNASEEVYNRDETLETYAYQFIHTNNPEKIFKNMKFDVIIGNPPYQLNNGGGSGSGATPIYNKFVEQAIKLKPRYISMIIPSRWFTVGMGLDSFRINMLKDKRIKKMIDHTDANDCFSGLNINGGVNYFLWDSLYSGDCEFTYICNGKHNTALRKMDEFEIFIRFNECINIIHKVKNFNENSLKNIISSQTPFGFLTNQYGADIPFKSAVLLHSSKGIGFVKKSEITRNQKWIDNFKVVIGKAVSGHDGEMDINGQAKIIASIKLLKPNEICTQSYLVVGPSISLNEAENLMIYLKTKFVRFLMMPQILSISISKQSFQFVPTQDFSETWTDEKLYKKYDINKEEIAFIESMIRPMVLDKE